MNKPWLCCDPLLSGLYCIELKFTEQTAWTLPNKRNQSLFNNESYPLLKLPSAMQNWCGGPKKFYGDNRDAFSPLN